jgi:hypothetical protein
MPVATALCPISQPTAPFTVNSSCARQWKTHEVDHRNVLQIVPVGRTLFLATPADLATQCPEQRWQSLAFVVLICNVVGCAALRQTSQSDSAIAFMDPMAGVATLPDESLSTELTGPVTGTTAKLLFIDPYQPGKVPGVLIHGLFSSPEDWADAIGEILRILDSHPSTNGAPAGRLPPSVGIPLPSESDNKSVPSHYRYKPRDLASPRVADRHHALFKRLREYPTIAAKLRPRRVR